MELLQCVSKSNEPRTRGFSLGRKSQKISQNNRLVQSEDRDMVEFNWNAQLILTNLERQLSKNFNLFQNVIDFESKTQNGRASKWILSKLKKSDKCGKDILIS